MRLENLLPVTGQREAVRRCGASQVRRVEGSVRIEEFAVTDNQLLPGRPTELQSGPSAHVLTEIEDGHA